MEFVSNNQDLSLVIMTFLPMLAACTLAFLPGRWSRPFALMTALVTLAISIGMMPSATLLGDYGELSSYFRLPWVTEYNLTFTLGMDGLSSLMIVLTNLLVIISIFASWTAIEKRRKEFYGFLLVLQTGIIGTFLALDLLVFYIFWELMLIPLYFLIGIFGSGNRIFATVKFFLYTFAGSLLMLVAILVLYFKSGEILPGGPSFLLSDLLGTVGGGTVSVSQSLPYELQTALFLAFAIAFMIKIPLFPFHTWLPDAHTEAPTAGSILLAGVLLKTGVYGLMRFAIPLFPDVAAAWAPTFMLLATIAIIFGALTAIAQDDMKRLVAYSSVSHMGFIVLGLFAATDIAVQGASLQMVNHGISTGALFFCVGILYERRHTRDLAEFGGLAYRLKTYTILTVIVVLSSVGLPGLNGFVGEFLILIGSFETAPILTAISVTGVIFAAVYLLRMVQRTFFGPLDNEANKELKDVNFREFISLAVLIALAFWIGLFPNFCLKLVEPVSTNISALMERVEDTPAPESHLAEANSAPVHP